MPNTKSHKTARPADTYMELVRRFPLKTIKNDDEHEQATGVISELMGRDLDSGVRGPGVHHDDLVARRGGLPLDPFEARADVPFLVEGPDDDRDARCALGHGQKTTLSPGFSTASSSRTVLSLT